MKHRLALPFLAVFVLDGATPRLGLDSPRELIRSALDFMGGEAALRAVRSVRVVDNRVTFSLGQGETPATPQPMTLPLHSDTYHEIATGAFAARRSIAGLPNTTYYAAARDSALMITRTDTSLRRSAAGAAAIRTIRRSHETYLVHVTLLSALEAPDAALRPLPPRVLNGETLAGVEARLPGDTVTLWFDRSSGAPVLLGRTLDDPARGAVERLTAFGTWTRVSNVRLPLRLTNSDNGALRDSYHAVSLEVNPAPDTLLQQPLLAILPLPPVAPRALTEIAPGIIRFENTVGFNGLAVRQGDSIIVIDPPLNDELTRGLLDSLRVRFPGQRVKSFIVSHHHWDHLGGARAAFAAGLSAITARENVDLVRRAGLRDGERPSRTRRVTPVDDSLAVGSGASRFVLHRVSSAHARGLLVAWFPEPKLLLEVDLAVGLPWQQRELRDFVQSRGLAVDRLVRYHGQVVSWSSFAASVRDE